MKALLSKTLIILSLIILLLGIAEAQEGNNKTYVDQDGKLYWNKHMPFYLRISSSPDDAGVALSSNPGEKPGANYLDTEGVNWIRTRWQFDEKTGHYVEPLHEVLWPVYADGLAPNTSYKLHYDGAYTYQGKHYYNEDFKVELNAKDGTSGVRKIMYKLNGELNEYASPISFKNSQDAQSLEFFAIDNVSNQEESKKPIVLNNIVIDAASPLSKLSVNGPNEDNILSGASHLHIEGEDSQSGIKGIFYQIDEGRLNRFVNDINTNGLKEGEHVAQFYAVDNVNNQEKIKNYSFYLDKTAPTVTFQVQGDSYIDSRKHQFISESSKVELQAVDNKAGVMGIIYHFDNDEKQDYGSVLHQNLSEGKHHLYYSAVDKVHNTSMYESVALYVDKTAPIIDINLNGPEMNRNDTFFVHNSTSIKAIAIDKGINPSGTAVINYSINGSESKVYPEEGLSFDEPGYKKLTIYSTDNVNNLATRSFDIMVDNFGPVVSHEFNVSKIGSKTIMDQEFDIYPKEVKVYLSAQDKHVGTNRIYYSINDGEEKQYIHPIEFFKDHSNILISVRAIDFLGNEEKKEFQFSVESILAKRTEIKTDALSSK